jgi:hypothetical protein
MSMQFAATKNALGWSAAWIFMGVVAQADGMAAAGVIAGLLGVPAALFIDWRRSAAARRLRPIPQLLLSPPR